MYYSVVYYRKIGIIGTHTNKHPMNIGTYLDYSNYIMFITLPRKKNGPASADQGYSIASHLDSMF